METRHYIGVTPLGRLHITAGPDEPDAFRDEAGRLIPPTEPIPTRNGVAMLYPVSAEIAAEWDNEDDQNSPTADRGTDHE